MMSKIIVDTREQLPLFRGSDVIVRKLEEGDYNTEFLEDKIVIERKSPADLYGSIAKGHIRFADEIQRARLKHKTFYIVVECTHEEFITKQFEGSYYCKIPGRTLAKIISTMEERYCIIFVWTSGRVAAKKAVRDIIETNNKLYNHIQ